MLLSLALFPLLSLGSSEFARIATEESIALIRTAFFGKSTVEGATQNEQCVEYADTCATVDAEPNPVWGISVDFDEISVSYPTANGELLPGLTETGVEHLCGSARLLDETITRHVLVDNVTIPDDRLAYIFQGHHESGGLIQYPRVNYCPSDYDVRLRPWYAVAATGPKNVIIVLDVSQSMLLDGAVDRALELVTTFIRSILLTADYVQIITAGTGVSDDGYALFGDGLLVRATPEAQAELIAYANASLANVQGRSSIATAAAHAFSLVLNSRRAKRLNSCHGSIVVVTAGEWSPNDLDADTGVRATLSRLNTDDWDMRLFAYNVAGPNAVTGEANLLPLTCDHKGMYSHIPEGGAPLRRSISSYLDYFAAASVRVNAVRWVLFEDAFSNQTLLSGCLPILATDEVPKTLDGVICVDITLYAPSLDYLEAQPDWNLTQAHIASSTLSCSALSLSQTDLNVLRERNSGASAKCPIIEEGQSEPALIAGVIVATLFGIAGVIAYLLMRKADIDAEEDDAENEHK